MKKILSLVILLAIVLIASLLTLLPRSPATGVERIIQGQPISYWVKNIKNGGFPDEQDPALDVLVGEGPRIMPNLCNLLLANESPQEHAFAIFGRFVPDENNIRYENRSDILSLKANAAEIMSVIAYQHSDAPEVKASIPSFVSALQSSSRFVRYASAQGLGAIGRSASNAIPDLIAATKAEDSSTGMCAVEALGRIGISTPPVIIALKESTSDESNSVSITAVQALNNLQKSAPELLQK